MSTTASPTDDASPRRPSSDREIDETVLPAESENTAYSIDLDALLGGGGGIKDDDGDLTLDDTEPFDTVRSSDVDGPSDFTQNMEFWMRTRLPLERQKKRSPSANTAAAQTAPEEDAVEENTLPLPPPRSSAPTSFDSRDHVSDSEGEEDNDEHDDAAGSEHGSYEYGQSEQGEDTREVAAAAMQDLHGYVISDEDTFMPPGSRRGSSTIGDDNDDASGSQQGSIDEQIDILSSMDDVNEEDYRSGPASPAPRQEEWGREITPAHPRTSWLQPTVEDHEDTPPPLSNRPSPRSGGVRAPEVRIEDYEDHLRKNEEARRRAGLAAQESAANSRTSSSKNDSDEDADDLRAQIKRLRNELERQREDFTSQIASLEKQLHRTRAERDEARENEQRRVRDLNAQHNDRAQDLEDHWQRRLAMAQERYDQDVQEQKAAFALVKSSFESRLSATESGLQAQFAQKDAELDAARSAHRQELEQQRAGHDAKVASLDDRIKGLQQQAALATGDRPGSPTSAELALAQQQKAESDARIAELEARLGATLAHLETARASSLSSSFHSDSARLADERRQTDELLERSRCQVEDLETNMALLQEQLGLARRETDGLRRDADAARESARVLRDELREAQGRVADGTRRVGVLERARDEDGDMAEAARRDVVRMLENVRGELVTEKARVRELEGLVDRVRGEKEGVRKRAEEAVRVAGTRLNGERIEKAGLRRALDGLRTEVETLRSAIEGRKKELSSSTDEPDGVYADEHTDTFSSPDSRSSELESLRRALRDADLSAKAAQEDARRAREETTALKEDFISVNHAMDERMLQALRTREKEWRRKMDALEKEKKVLGRALLHQWGREEVGEGEPQGYRYKFVKKSHAAVGRGEPR
ncbi:hypothetical protein GTA08_BOTSDO01485 [Botryosphaeria dothidea]|uniref:Spindle pole body associated protein n=1 Tax=Botryosphaeria dothidea TaxID=55169 RepID=A0A8H4J5X2_9PEZI|nr:hypothetical protein GTA08_BOTSDO01485 [Botryosphaeria dothidea]